MSEVAAGFNSKNLAHSIMVMVHIHTEFNLSYEKKRLVDLNDGNLCLVELKARSLFFQMKFLLRQLLNIIEVSF